MAEAWGILIGCALLLLIASFDPLAQPALLRKKEK